MLYRWEGTTGKFSIINWVDKVNWPPLRVSKLTFRALVLRHSEWRNCGNIPSVATVTYKLMATKLRQSFRRFHRKPIFQSIQRSQTRTKRSLHEQLYRRYLSSREELTQFITTVKFFHLVLKDTWEISDTSLASLGIKNFNLKQHSMHYSVYYKPTDSCYFSYSSSHPSHVKTSKTFFRSYSGFVIYVAILFLSLKRSTTEPKKLMGSQHHKRHRRKMPITFHSFTLTTTQLNLSFLKTLNYL